MPRSEVFSSHRRCGGLEQRGSEEYRPPPPPLSRGAEGVTELWLRRSEKQRRGIRYISGSHHGNLGTGPCQSDGGAREQHPPVNLYKGRRAEHCGLHSGGVLPRPLRGMLFRNHHRLVLEISAFFHAVLVAEASRIVLRN